MAFRGAGWWVVGGVAVAVAACGGSSQDGIFGKPSGTGGVGANGGVSGSGGVGGSGGASASGGVSGSGGVGASGGIGASGGLDGSVGASGGVSGSGGGGVGGKSDGGGTGASGGTGGATGGGGAVGVGTGPCGSMTCAFAAGDTCCVTQNPGDYCSNDSLGNPCNCQGIACHSFQITCDGPEDCAGKICCADTGFLGGAYDVVECRDTCVSDAVGATRKEVCHPGGKACGNGTACTPDPGLPPGYSSCGK